MNARRQTRPPTRILRPFGGGWAGWLGALLLTCAAGFGAASLNREGTLIRVANERIATTFNLHTGEWEVLTADGVVLATGLRCYWGKEPEQSSLAGVASYSFVRVRQPLGAGLRIELERGRQRPFDLALTVYDQGPFVLAQVRAPRSRWGGEPTPVRFEGSLAPGTGWSGRKLLSFASGASWTAQVQATTPTASEGLRPGVGLLFLEDPAPGTQGILLAGSSDLANAKFLPSVVSSAGKPSLVFTASWSQAPMSDPRSPSDGLSSPLVISAPLPAATAAEGLRRILRATRGGGESNPDLAAVAAWDRLRNPPPATAEPPAK